MMSRKDFGEFMDFFLKGLNPFKIQTYFKLEFFLEFIILDPFGILTHSHKESCFFTIYLPPCQVWKFLEFQKYQLHIVQV
jgi:hypothetical protein